MRYAPFIFKMIQKEKIINKRMVLISLGVIALLIVLFISYSLFNYDGYNEGYNIGVQEGMLFTIYKIIESVETNGFIQIDTANQSMILVKGGAN